VHRLIRTERPDVVHANSIRAGLLASSGRIAPPVVVHCRDLLPPGIAANAVRSVTLRQSAATIAVSRAAAVRLAGADWARRGVHVVDNPVDTSRFDPAQTSAAEARESLGVTGRPVLGVIAQITPWKGHDRAIRVLDHVRRTHPDAELVVVGEAKFTSTQTTFDNQAYARELRALVRDRGLTDAVHFLGERTDVERILASMDILLVPSTEEPFGRTIIEAMAMGVPVIATNAGGPDELIRPLVDGITLDPDAIDEWAAQVESLIRRPSGCGAGSRDYAIARFSPSRHAQTVRDVYEQVIRKV
jgi:glycosyltransferase involved in cell wall biosynthesis